MPLLASTNLQIKPPTISVGSANLVSETAIGFAAVNQVGPLTELGRLQQFDSDIEAGGVLSLFETEFQTISPLALHDTDIETTGSLRDILEEITSKASAYLQVGTVPSVVNPFQFSTPLVQVQSNHILFQRIPVFLQERFLYSSGPMLQISGSLLATEDMILVDLLGPQILNELPLQGSTFNNPLTSITFDLIDTGGSDISLSGTEVYVNGTQVISAGADVTPSGFGTTIFTPISSTFYQFQFTSATPFLPDTAVTVSGRSSDVTPSGNVEFFSYDFRVWQLADLSASITGLPDTIPPFLENISPAINETEVVVNTDILFTVNDLHTGVDLSSVILEVEGETVFSGAQDVSQLYEVSHTSTSDGRGLNFTINPTTDFSFDQQVDINVTASDLYSPANSVNTSYSFFTIANDHLVASGLQIFEDSTFVDMNVAASYTTVSSTSFHITYLNLDGNGLSTSGSSVQLDGVDISSTITAVSGNPLAYDVFFDLAPDYTDNAILTFHVVQSGTVSGTTLFRDITTELLWGYEFCYDTDKLSHDTEFNYNVQVCDRGDKPTLGTLTKNFHTTPLDSSRLFASIYPIDPPSEPLNAVLVSNNTFFEFGKTMYLEVDVADFAGNTNTFSWSFTIEDE